jgi:transcriptional regulator with XRE-family HTH domain
MKRITLPSQDEAALRAFASRIKLARLKRNLTQIDMAERAGIGRLSYLALENGNPGTSLATVIRVMNVLGYPEWLETILQSDPIGDDLVAFYGRKRAGGRRDLEDF